MSVTEPTGLQLIVAVARGGAIGRAGTLPWSAPEDMTHFRRTTMGHALIMGSRTWASIGRPLPGRRTIVVSSRRLEVPADVVVAPDPDKALVAARDTDPMPFVVGGAAIYGALLPQVERVHLTELDVAVDGADTFFAPLDPAVWVEMQRFSGEDERLSFVVLDRR